MAMFHWLGTKPLAVSLCAQFVVLGVALRGKDGAQIRQSLTMIVALALTITSISLRPPQPAATVADVLGVCAGALYLVPGVQALLKLRRKEGD